MATAPETQEQAKKTALKMYCTYKFYPCWSVWHSSFMAC